MRFKNAEFQRNVWLEISPHRLILLPVIFAIIYSLLHFSRDAGEQMIFGFLALTILWGGWQAGHSVSQEIIDKTWDGQRMTGLNPWAMTWGKLFGSTIYVWYGALFCLFAVIQFSASVGFGRGYPAGFVTLLYLILFLVVLSILLQSFCFSASILLLQQKSHSRFLPIAILLMCFWFGSALTLFFNTGFVEYTHWYGVMYEKRLFILFSLTFFCICSVFSCYRLVRLELQVPGMPFYWIAFVLLVSFYFAGLFLTKDYYDFLRPFSNSLGPLHFRPVIYIIYFTILALSYFLLLIENKDPMVLRRVQSYWKQKRWVAVLETVPLWLVTAFVLLLTTVILVGISGGQGGFYFAAIFTFFMRDLCLFVLLNMTINRKRSNLLTLVYLIVLYILLPALLSNFFPQGSVTGLFVPIIARVEDSHSVIALTSGLIQLFIVALLLRNRWRAFFKFTPA